MDAAFLRSKAAQCRDVADIALNVEIRQALDNLARELEDAAARLESCGEPERRDAEETARRSSRA